MIDKMNIIFILFLMIFSGSLAYPNANCNYSIIYDPVAILAEINARPDEPITEEFLSLMDKKKPTNCLPFSSSSSGIHEIQLEGFNPFLARCEIHLAGPGWMVIQRRINGSVDFYRNWTEYRNGFGDLNGEFWLGLEKLHRLTKNRPHEFLLYIQNFRNETSYTLYDNFEIAGEEMDYEIMTVGGIFGNTWLRQKDRIKFTTFDRKNQGYYDDDKHNSAEFHHSAWWYGNDGYSYNVNGIYYDKPKKRKDAIWSYSFKKYSLSIEYLKYVQILIRPKLNKRAYFINNRNTHFTWDC